MARRTTALIFGILTATAATSACTTGTGAPTDDPECQIQAEGEKSPGYPYDLATYTSDVLPVLTANCSAGGCHGAPAGQGGFTVWADAAQGNCGFAQTFNSLSLFVDLATPENSALLVAVSGALPGHPVVYDAQAPQLAALTGFVGDAAAVWAADGGGGTAPPGASPFDYAIYQQIIQPILDGAEGRGCATSGVTGPARRLLRWPRRRRRAVTR